MKRNTTMACSVLCPLPYISPAVTYGDSHLSDTL